MRSVPDQPIVCYVTGGREFSAGDRQPRLLQQSRAAVDARVDWVQIREKDLSANVLLNLVREAVAASRHASARILVNGRLDVALAAEAQGVHLGAETIPLDATVQWRQTSGTSPEFLIGASCHSIEEAKRAAASGADYIFFGPVFDTPAKRVFGEPQGIDRLSRICRAVSIPVLAIGGVNETNALECLRAGAKGVAAIRLFQESRDPGDLAEIVAHIHSFR